VRAVTERLGRALMNEIWIIEGQWRQQNRAAEEAERLAAALEEVSDAQAEGVRPPQRQLSGSFLEETVKAKIESLVQEARSAAENGCGSGIYRDCRMPIGATLRAAVRRERVLPRKSAY